MAQYCRYCAHAHVSDWLWCDVKEELVSDYRAKKPNSCKHFDLNPIDAYGENPNEYAPRKPKPKPEYEQLDLGAFLGG